jgi:hypothetical protein
MVQGQSIAPNSDKTMKVPGAIGELGESKSINPTDYMGMSFQYQKWLDEKKKEYENAQKAKAESTEYVRSTELPALKENEKKIEALVDKDAYNKFVAQQEKVMSDWNATHGPVTGGSFQYMDRAIDKYNKDYATDKSDVDLHYKEMQSATNKDDYNKAKNNYLDAISKLESTVKANPTTEEGKEKYKDEIKTGYSQGINYAAGWGVGGYHGTGAGSTALADQMLANIISGKIGTATPMKLKTQTETMTDLGFKYIKDSETGELGWYGFKDVKDDKGNVVQKLEKYTGEIPKGIALVDTGTSTSTLADMMKKFSNNGQRATDEQIADATKTSMASELIKQQNQLLNLATYAKMFPTDANKAKLNEYASAISNPETIKKEYDIILKGFQDLAGKVETAKTNFGEKTGTVLGRDIYQSREGGEYVVAGGKQVPLSTVTAQRQLAGMTGEYTLFNNPGYGGDVALRGQSESAKQWLYTNFGDAGKVAEPNLQRVGDIKVEGTILPIVQSGGREYVKPATGSLIPLSNVLELKNLSTKSGEFATNTDLYNQEMDLIRSYKDYTVNKSPESRVAVEIAIQNARSNPMFDQERITRALNIATTGSVMAGMTVDNNKLKPDSNIAKGILAFTSQSPLDNVVFSKLLSTEDANKPIVRDVIQKMPKYGDPMIGVIKLNSILSSNIDTGKGFDDLSTIDRNSKGYDKVVDRLAFATTSSYLNEDTSPYVNNRVFGIQENAKIREVPQEKYSDIVQVNPSFSFNKQAQYTPLGESGSVTANLPANKYANAGDMVNGMIVKSPFLSSSTFTNKTPSRDSLDSALVFKKKGTQGLGFGMNTTGISIKSLYRKSKKSKPKADIKLKKKSGKKNKKSDEFSDLTKNISKFTLSIPSPKKSKKK